MIDLILWLVMVEALALLAFPFAFVLFPALRDRGYALAKPLGLLLLAYPVWLLGSAQAPLGPRATAAVVLVALAAASAALAWRLRPGIAAFARSELRLLAFTEALFLGVFALWALLRAMSPDIGHTEQPMDFAFLNASMRAAAFPPPDPWLAGHGINYYYFGYLTMGLPGVLMGIAPSVVYNLALALLPAMAAAAAFSLTSSLASMARAPWQLAAALGLASVAALAFAGNLEGVFELLRAWGVGGAAFWDWVGIRGLDGPAAAASFFPQEFWWWWRSSRVIDTVAAGVSMDPTIQEYPFFSWFLGDLHAHVMALPFVLLFTAFCVQALADGTPLGAGWWRRRWPFGVAMGMTLGALGFINAWDLPLALGAGVGVAALCAHRGVRRGAPPARAWAWAASAAAALLLLAFVPFLPWYWGALAGQIKGVAAVAPFGSVPLHFLTVWGLFAAAVGAGGLTLLRRWGSPGGGRRVPMPLFAAAFAPLALWAVFAVSGGHGDAFGYRVVVALPLSIALGVALVGAVNAPAGPRGAPRAAVWGLAALGIAIVLGPELFYVVDFFDNRMNTVFKLYYHAWIILAVAAPLTLYFGLRSAMASGLWRRRLGAAVAVGVAALAILSLYLPAGMALSVRGGAPLTLDGAAYLEDSAPGEHAVIQWLHENADAADVIVEAVGGDYSDFGRVASFTGQPSPLNWAGHQLQWRGSHAPMAGRAADVAAIYGAADPNSARAILDRYDARYVVLGPRERSAYGVESLDALAGALTPVFAHADYVLYGVAGDD